jgi:hypothetical protein
MASGWLRENPLANRRIPPLLRRNRSSVSAEVQPKPSASTVQHQTCLRSFPLRIHRTFIAGTRLSARRHCVSSALASAVPSDDRGTRNVFITRGIPPGWVEALLDPLDADVAAVSAGVILAARLKKIDLAVGFLGGETADRAGCRRSAAHWDEGLQALIAFSNGHLYTRCGCAAGKGGLAKRSSGLGDAL